jgi:hypothetical protein
VSGSDTPLSTPRSNISGPLAPIVEVNTPNVSSAASMAPLAASAALIAANNGGDGMTSFVLSGARPNRLNLDDELSSFGGLRLSDNDDIMSPLAPQRDQPFTALMSPAPQRLMITQTGRGHADAVHTETTSQGDSVKM